MSLEVDVHSTLSGPSEVRPPVSPSRLESAVPSIPQVCIYIFTTLFTMTVLDCAGLCVVLLVIVRNNVRWAS